jgi:hypothetical protein
MRRNGILYLLVVFLIHFCWSTSTVGSNDITVDLNFEFDSLEGWAHAPSDLTQFDVKTGTFESFDCGMYDVSYHVFYYM